MSTPLPDAPPLASPTEPEETIHEWAGDLFEGGEASDPSRSFAQFAGPEGETAWLDKADDGTLTGWVRDSDGSVFRYADADAWHIDVDQAGMRRSDAGDLNLTGAPSEDEPVENAPTGEPTADEPAADELTASEAEDPTGEDAPDVEQPSEEPSGEAVPDETPEDSPDEEEEDEDAFPFEQKSWLGPGGVTLRAVPA